MIKNTFATKSDIKQLKTDIIEQLDKKVKTYIVNSEVKILGELKNMREDNGAHQFSHMRINDDLIEHDNRLKKLETIAVI